MNPPNPTAVAEAPPETPPRRPLRLPRDRHAIVDSFFRFQSLFGLVAVFLIAIAVSPVRNGENVFLSSGNLANIVRAVSEIGIIAVGMTFVILIGGSTSRSARCSGWPPWGRPR